MSRFRSWELLKLDHGNCMTIKLTSIHTVFGLDATYYYINNLAFTARIPIVSTFLEHPLKYKLIVLTETPPTQSPKK